MSNQYWNDVRHKLPNFIVDGEIITNMPVDIRRADGREERTIYQGFGHFGYAPDYIQDVTHWRPAFYWKS